VLRYVAEHGITHILWVPTMLYDILDVVEAAPDIDTSRLEMIMCGGQPISADFTERAQTAFPHTAFVQVYGLTEGGGSVTFVPPEALRTKPGSAGRPSMFAQIRLVDEHDDDVAVGTDGEIVIRAPSMTAGYWDDPELTATLLRGGWLHTGDMGRFDEDGFLYVSGRKGDMIISGGMNIFPSEIEDVLRRHPSVADVAVIGLPHAKWGESVCAVIQALDGATIDEQEVISYCYERLAGYKKPSHVQLVDELPRTASGKVQKYVLRQWFAEQDAPAS
jgi:fatty-acyl-CoA synthase